MAASGDVKSYIDLELKTRPKLNNETSRPV